MRKLQRTNAPIFPVFKDKYLPIKVKIEDLEHQPTRDEEHHLFLQMLWDYVDKKSMAN